MQKQSADKPVSTSETMIISRPGGGQIEVVRSTGRRVKSLLPKSEFRWVTDDGTNYKRVLVEC